MSIHKVTNTFVGNGSALEANVTTLTPGKLGVFKMDQTALGAGSPYVAGTATQKIQLSETFADGSFKKSMWIDGASLVNIRTEAYTPATREVWSVGYDRKAAAGTIEVNNSSDYTLNIRFKNDKSLYSERPEVLRVNFTSSASASQLSVATQIANAINNSGFKTLVEAKVVSNGPFVAATSTTLAVFGDGTLGAATNYGVEISALDINQFQSSTYKENRVYFSCHVDDSTGFGATTTCTQISANSYGEGTYNYVYNKENFDYQYEGLLNRRLWPAQTPKFNVNSTSVNTGALTVTGSLAAGNDMLTLSAGSTGQLRTGELITVGGVNYEVKYIIGSGAITKVILTTAAPSTLAGQAITIRCFYSLMVIEFNDNSFTSGADLISVSRKSIYIATPAINTSAPIAGNTIASVLTTASTEAQNLRDNIGAWAATTPVNINALTLAF